MNDVFFISHGEPNADENFARLVEIVPGAKRVDGVDGIHNAHRACAERSSTTHFHTVDADNWVYDASAFEPFEADPRAVYVWRCRNAVNDLVYGYGAIKLFPRDLVLAMDHGSVDMTTSVSTDYRIVNVLASETRFNTSPFEAWKSGFRECAKLASGLIHRQKDEETAHRLAVWMSKGATRPFGEDCLRGALVGAHYGRAGNDLARINDWAWLRLQFEGTKHE